MNMIMDITHRYSTEPTMNMVTDITHRYSTDPSDENGYEHQSLDAFAANRVSGYVFARLVDSDFLDDSDSDIIDDSGNDVLGDTDSEFTDDTDSDSLDDSDFFGGTEWLSQ